MELFNKTVLLTGASGGIGSAIATMLAKQGARLLLVGRDLEKLQRLQEQLNEFNKEAGEKNHQIVNADITTGDGRNKITQIAEAESIDLVINNASTNALALLESMTDDSVEKLLLTNLYSPMLLCKALIPILMRKSESAIVNVGSILGSIGYAGSSVYCASKFGLRGFTEALRRELADTQINVFYLAPRATNTGLNTDEMRAMNKVLGNATDSPEQVANALLTQLQSKGNWNRYIGWPEKLFVRINSVLPQWVDKAVFGQLPVIRRYAGHQDK